jgi:hypothetical protein
MLAFLFVAVIVITVIGLGYSVVIRLDRSHALNDAERLLFSFLIGFYFIYYGVFFIGPFRLDTLSMSLLGGICVVFSIPGIRSAPWKAYLAFPVSLIREKSFSSLIFVMVTAVAASSLVQALAPPNDFDAISYHLPIPLRDVELGQISLPTDFRAMQALWPAMAGNLSRFILVFSSGETAQLAHSTFGLAAALGTALLVIRLGGQLTVALIGALFFLVARVVIWEMGTVETDVPFAAFSIASVIVYTVWRSTYSPRLAVLFGLMIGGTILTKYLGFTVALSFAGLMLYDAISSRKSWKSLPIGPLMAAVVILPHVIRNFATTSNPVFPLFNATINPGEVSPLDSSIADALGTGRGLWDLITAPWNLSIYPMHYYDGMVLGAPYFLAFLPLALLDRKALASWLPGLSICALYFIMWFWLLSQQIRFLLPILPVIAGLAAVGLAAMWSQVSETPFLKWAFALTVLVIGLNQAMFVGVYAGIRLPVAVGLMSPNDYHKKTPTMGGAYYETCTFLKNNLKAGEAYYASIIFPSYYCPQASMTYKRFPDELTWIKSDGSDPSLTFDEFLEKAKSANFRYYIFPTVHVWRRDDNTNYAVRQNLSAKTEFIQGDQLRWRFDEFLKPVLAGLRPVAQGPRSAVYDGPQVLKGLMSRR